MMRIQMNTQNATYNIAVAATAALLTIISI